MLNTVLTRLLSYAALIAAARVLLLLLGSGYCYFKQVNDEGPKSLSGLIRFLFPRKLIFGASLRIDLSLVVLRGLAGHWGVVPVAGVIIMLTPVVYSWLMLAFGVEPQLAPTPLSIILIVVLLMLARDGGEYAAHKASHKNAILWEFHKAHHSTEFLNPFSAKRAHFIDDIVRVIFIAPLLGTAGALLAYTMNVSPATILGLELDAYMVGNLLAFETLRHSHVPLTFGRAEAYLMSPAQHQLHHKRRGVPCNFGSFLSLWDRMFGTFVYSTREKFEIGLNPADQANYDSVVKLIVRPFWNVGVLLLKASRNRYPTTTDVLRSGGLTSSD